MFLEVGPGSSCTRLIGQILGRRPHLAGSACRAEGDPFFDILDLVGRLIAERVPVDLAGLYGRDAGPEPLARETPPPSSAGRSTIQVEVRGSQFHVPAMPSRAVTASAVMRMPARPPDRALPERTQVLQSILGAASATAEAHRTFLRVSDDSAALIARHVAYEFGLIDEWERRRAAPGALERSPIDRDAEPKVVLDRRACREFAVGSIAAALGMEFAPVDAFPTRVRLPDEPLLLVDRVLSIEGIARSMQGGRIVTEHEVGPEAWYLDARRIVPSISIEAGQADLLLCGYLGIDFETKGLAVYRLLDATVKFLSSLPGAGDVIRYDIHIEAFFRQGQTILFRFRLDATVDGRPFLSMRDGRAGFFSTEELASGRGILPRAIDLRARSGGSPATALDLLPPISSRLDESQLEALRSGNLFAAFGPPFDRLKLAQALLLPSGLLGLLHRVARLETNGGSLGLGFIRAEADIHPDDWFLVCHFVDDRVMPGTLMYESCLQALRILLVATGAIGECDRVAFEPVTGVPIRLKCRGQVVESTPQVIYEVTVTERGYRPEPYAIADAMVIVAGKPIVELSGISLQLSGTNRQELEALWDAEPRAALVFFDCDRILEFALGSPVRAFGDGYRAFENGRFLARLPGPPFQCVHRILRTDAKPWVMESGTTAVAEYDIDRDAWFFAADRQDSLPLAILLEVALQPCGWLAAYMGSALTSTEDLQFRNLGGKARQHRRVGRHSGTLRTRVKTTKITRAAGMILQSYEFAIESAEGLVYDGTADFGFFPASAMRDQVGIRDAAVYRMSAEECSQAPSLVIPDRPPFPDSKWRMVDQVDEVLESGGPHGLGVIRGSSEVDSTAWFFAAHFKNDPVWPGSLGLESMMQLLKVMAAARWGTDPGTAFESPVVGAGHSWTYRGQIVPTDHRVVVQVVIKARDEELRRLLADGHLEVDGKVIYQMHDFAIGHSGS